MKSSQALTLLHEKFFSSWANSCTTMAILYFCWLALPPLFNWAVVNAVWLPQNADLCRSQTTPGACWAFVGEKFRFILFGTFPADQHWRPVSAILIMLTLYVLSTWRRAQNRILALAWCVGLAAGTMLLRGGFLGLSLVETDRWGGLCLTLLLATVGLIFAFPFSVLLALGRRSNLPVIRWFCVIYIELIRGVPLISVLFMASVMLPLFLPTGVSLDKLLRVQLAIILFAAAYLAEVVRGGLQAIPQHQEEAALALGHGYWQRTWHIVLPQALRTAIPPLVNTIIGLFKDTSLVVIIGLFDFLTAIKVSLSEPRWVGFGLEAYLFAAAGYFLFCYPLSRYSQTREQDAENTLARRGSN